MDPVTNPFAPGAGTQPPELVGRDAILERTRVTLERVKRGYNAKSFLLVGLRGVGKTVLLNKVEEFALRSGYMATMIEAQESKDLPELLIPALRKILLRLNKPGKVNEIVQRSIMVLKAFASSVKISLGDVGIGFDIQDQKGTADSGDIGSDLPDLLEALGEAAKSQEQSIAIIIDELQYVSEEEFGALIMSMHRIAQKKLPVILIGAGLPPLVGLAGKSKSYAERLFDYPSVGALVKEDAKIALTAPAEREGVKFEKQALEEIVSVTKGYPYFIQEWGFQAWNAADKSPITLEDVRKASDQSRHQLDESFFRVRLDRVSPREKDYLFAMAKLGAGPHRSGDIAGAMGVTIESIAPIRSSLIKKGMIYSPAYGDTGFTVPMFDEYLKRVIAKSNQT